MIRLICMLLAWVSSGLHLRSPMGILETVFISKKKDEKVSTTPEKVEDIATSAGALGIGVEQTDSSLSTLATQINTSLQTLSLKLDSSIASTELATETLIINAIQDKQNELSAINAQIHLLLRKTDNLYTECSGFRTCKACSLNSLCV